LIKKNRKKKKARQHRRECGKTWGGRELVRKEKKKAPLPSFREGGGFGSLQLAKRKKKRGEIEKKEAVAGLLGPTKKGGTRNPVFMVFRRGKTAPQKFAPD